MNTKQHCLLQEGKGKGERSLVEGEMLLTFREEKDGEADNRKEWEGIGKRREVFTYCEKKQLLHRFENKVA
jgi:hypothetical protein